MKYAPMLAKGAKDEAALLVDSGYVAERKYDGHRMAWEILDGEQHLFSRLGNDRLEDAPFLQVIGRGLVSCGVKAIFDGELMLPGGTSSDVGAIKNRDKLKYVIFDILQWRDEELISSTYARRRLILEFVFQNEGFGTSRIQLAEVSDKPSVLLDRVKAEGGEGIMMKNRSGKYRPGKRSWDWQKIKMWDTMSVVITSADAPPSKWTVTPGHYGTDGVLYPEGKRTSTAEAGFVGLEYGFWIDDAPTTIGKLGVTGPREEMEKYVGHVAEVKHYGQYARTHALRHPQFLGFRDDVRREDCTVTQE